MMMLINKKKERNLLLYNQNLLHLRQHQFQISMQVLTLALLISLQ